MEKKKINLNQSLLSAKKKIIKKLGKSIEAKGTANLKKRTTKSISSEKEKKYLSILNNIYDGYIETDLAGNFTFFNDSTCRILGYSRKELMGMNYRHYTDKKTAMKASAAYNKVRETGEPVKGFEWEIRRKDGVKRYIETSMSLQKDSSDKPIGFSGILRDITERKQAQQTLKESENKYRLSFENVSDIIIILDADLNISSVSPSIERILGYKPQDFIGQSSFHLSNIVAPESFQRAFTDVNLMLRGEIIPSAIHDFPAKDGTIKYFELNGSPLRQKGKIIGVISVARDVTEHKQAEDALRESEDRYKALVENASDMVVRTDKSGNFTFANASMIRMSGYESSEIIGKHFSTLINPDMRETAIEFFSKQFAERTQNTYSEYLVVKKDGSEFWVGQNTQLIFEDGNIVGFQAVSRDITERKQLEFKLKESEEEYRKLSIIDGLTKLYNSRHFYNQLNMEIERLERHEYPLTLLLFDIDNFKIFNDTYGHVEGDQVLSRLGQVIKRCIRKEDSAYRYGGEEFTIILPMTTKEEGIVTAERIREEFKNEKFSPLADTKINLTVSIGLAQYKKNEDIKAFVGRADHHMYQSKINGKDRTSYE